MSSLQNVSRDVDMVLSLYAARPILTVRQEYVVYDTMSLLADVAGTAGILLGLSCVTVYDGIIVSLNKFCRKAGIANRTILALPQLRR